MSPHAGIGKLTWRLPFAIDGRRDLDAKRHIDRWVMASESLVAPAGEVSGIEVLTS